MAVTLLHEGVSFRITAEDDGLIHARSLDDNMPAFLAEDAEEFTEIVREVHYVTLHDATGVLLAQQLARVTLEAERAWEAQEIQDPCAGIFVSDEEAYAFDEAVRRKKLRFGFYDGMDLCETSLDDLIRSNLDGLDFIEFLAKEILPLEVGQEATFNAGAGGETEFTRLPDQKEAAPSKTFDISVRVWLAPGDSAPEPSEQDARNLVQSALQTVFDNGYENDDVVLDKFEVVKLTRCGDCGDTGTIMNGDYCVCAVGREQEASLRESEEHAGHDDPIGNPNCRYCRRMCLRVELVDKDNREDDLEDDKE